METLGRAAQYLASPFEYSYDSGPRVYVNGFATREGKVASMHGLKTGIVFHSSSKDGCRNLCRTATSFVRIMVKVGIPASRP